MVQPHEMRDYGQLGVNHLRMMMSNTVVGQGSVVMQMAPGVLNVT